jgi:hypothetical protein
MSDERELTADGWPLGVTRKQILTDLGISRERAAECERMAALSEAEFEAIMAQRSEELMQKTGTSTKLSRRWLSKATQALHEAILETFEDTGTTWRSWWRAGIRRRPLRTTPRKQ